MGKILSAREQLALAVPTMHGQKNLELGVTWSPVTREFVNSDVLIKGTDTKIKDLLEKGTHFTYIGLTDDLIMAEVGFEFALNSYSALTGSDKEIREKALKTRYQNVDRYQKFLERLCQLPLGTKQELGLYCTNSLPQATRLNGSKIQAFNIDFNGLVNLNTRFLGMSDYQMVVEVNGKVLPLSENTFGLPNGYELGNVELTRDNNALVVTVYLTERPYQ